MCRICSLYRKSQKELIKDHQLISILRGAYLQHFPEYQVASMGHFEKKVFVGDRIEGDHIRG